jgi:uncharacterized protein YceK
MKNLLIAIIAAIALTSCSSINISSDRDGDVDFTKFSTFQLLRMAERE